MNMTTIRGIPMLEFGDHVVCKREDLEIGLSRIEREAADKARARDDLPERMIGAPKLAEILDVSYRNVLSMIKRGDFAGSQIGKRMVVPVSEVKRYLDVNKIVPDDLDNYLRIFGPESAKGLDLGSKPKKDER